MEALAVTLAGLIVIAAATALAPRIGLAAPLILVVVGIGTSFLPFVPDVEIDPEVIIAGVLPPLLYSAAASMPTMNFRREFRAISGLSVVLVVVSAFVLGWFFAWVIPGLDFWWGVALGAVVSPTDAVATSIVRQAGVSGRVVSVLEGESLINDATALVLLRTAVAATAASVSFWGALGTFAYSVVVAVVLGLLVGHASLWVRSKVTDATVNTVLSFTAPFLASIPAELLDSSGLVAAVVAGLSIGQGAARFLPPAHRISDHQNWRTIELVLEGGIFLVMGLELAGIVADVHDEHEGVGAALAIAAGALALILVVRTAYVLPLLAGLRRRSRHAERVRPRLDVMQQQLDDGEVPFRGPGRGRGNSPEPSPERTERMRTRITRLVADVDYLLAEPLGWREGAVLVWAGMRGAITVAAAQTLPADTPDRSLLVLVAFVVAAGSLLLQGGTLAWFVRWIGPAKVDEAAELEERRQILELLRSAAVEATGTEQPGPDTEQTPSYASFKASKRTTIAAIEAQRAALLEARDDGIYSAEALGNALDNLDADQISIELKGGPA